MLAHLLRPAALLALAVLGGCAPAPRDSSPPPGDLAMQPPPRLPDGPRTVLFGGKRVGYTVQGSGPTTLVLVHGWSSDRSVWRKQMEALRGAAVRVVALDLPGHGVSEVPAGGEGAFSMDLFADAIAAVMDDAGATKAVLAGHSNGVPTVRQFYRRYPGRTQGLILVDGSLRPMITDPAQQRQLLDGMREPAFTSRTVPMFVDPMLAPMRDPAERAAVRAMALRAPEATRVGGFRAAMDPVIWPEPPDPILVPTLVIQARSPFWDDAYEAFVRSIVFDLEYRVLPGVSHFLMIDDPDAFNALAAAWLEQRGFVKF